MKNITFVLISMLILINFALANHYVRSYYRDNGTLVNSHMSMNPYQSRDTGISYQNNVPEYNSF